MFANDLDDMQSKLAFGYRKIYLNGEVNAENIFRVIYYLQCIVEKDNICGDKSPIVLYINTYGGVCSEGFILVDMVNSLIKQGYEIITINIGKAFSFGLVLSLMGTKRYCYKHALYLYHQPATEHMQGSLEVCQRTIEQLGKIADDITDFIVEKTNITREFLDEKNVRCEDTYFSPEDALRLNICDEII